MQQGSRDLMGLQSVAKKVTASLATVGAGISAGLAMRGVLQTGASFEKVMSEVAARTKATSEQFAALQETAEQLGRSTIFDNDAAGRAMVELSKAGFSVEQIMSSVSDVLSLAAADNLDLADAAAITAGALKKFELDASQAGRVTDVLAKGAGSALTDVSSLGEQLAYAAGPAREAGYSIESTVAALAALSDKVDKSMAGTGLRQVISGLAKPSAEAQKTLDKLGISVTDASGNFRDLPSLVDDFNAALGNMASGDKLRTLSTIFEARTANAFAGLMSAGGDELRRLTGELNAAGGEAARLAAQMTDNVSGAYTSVWSAIKGFATDTFQLFAGPLKDALNGFASFVSGPVAKAFEAVTKNADFRPIVGAIGGVVAAGTGLVTVALGFKAMRFAAIPLIAIGRQIAATYSAAASGIGVAFSGVRQVGSGLKIALLGVLQAASSVAPVFTAADSAIRTTAASSVAFSRSVVASVSSSGLLQLPSTLSATFSTTAARIRLQSALIADVWYSVSGRIAHEAAYTADFVSRSYGRVQSAVASAAWAASSAWAAASVRIGSTMSLLSANTQIVAGTLIKPFAYAAGAVVSAWEFAAAKTSAGFARVAATSAYQSVATAVSVVRREAVAGVAAVTPIVSSAFGKAFSGITAAAGVMAGRVAKSFAAIKVAAIASAAPIGKAFGVVFAGIRVAVGGLWTALSGVLTAVGAVAAGIVGLGSILLLPAAAFAGVILASEKGVKALKAGWSSLSEHFAEIAVQTQRLFSSMFNAIVRIGSKALSALGIEFQSSGGDILDNFHSMMEGLGEWVEGALVDAQFFFDNFETYLDLGLAHVDKWVASVSARIEDLFLRDMPVAVAKGMIKLADTFGGNSLFEKMLGVDAASMKQGAELFLQADSLARGFTGGIRSKSDAERAAQTNIDNIAKGLAGGLDAHRWEQGIDAAFRKGMSDIDDAIRNGIPGMTPAGVPSGGMGDDGEPAMSLPSTGVEAMNSRQAEGPGIALRGTRAAFDAINRAIGGYRDDKRKEELEALKQIASNTAQQPESQEVVKI